MDLSVRTDRHLLRAAAESVRHLLVSITAPVAPPRAGRIPVNVAIVLDRSGSMAGELKFVLAREAVEQSIRQLREEDRFALVVYDSEVDTLVPATFATTEAKQVAMQRLWNVAPRGSTNLHGGWTTGAGELAHVLGADTVNRVLLVTDGLANAGVTDHAHLALQAAELRRAGIVTSTFGVGEDFDERLLRDIAHEGGGNFYFIQAPAQIPDLLASELGEALEVVCRDAALQVALPPGAEATLLNRFRTTYAAGDNELRVELGDLVSGQELAVVVRIRFLRGELGGGASVRVGLAGRDGIAQLAERELAWRYASHAENDAQPRDRVVDRAVAAIYAARARAEATEANREGDLPAARRVLEATARRIRTYALGDAELETLWRRLRSEVREFAESPMSAMSLKSALFVAESASRGRGTDGKARRKRDA